MPPIPPPGLTAEECARVAAPLEQAWTLPPAAYVREDVYAREADRVMRAGWAPVSRLDQTPNPGDYLCIDLMGQPLLVSHGMDGRVRVFSNVCRHRSAPVAEGAGTRKLFTCPYHAWSYDTEGRLVRAPLMEGAEGFSEADCSLPLVRSETWEGFILVNLDGEAAPFAPQVEGLRSYFEAFGMTDMVVARTLEFDSGWNWKVLVENFMEAYHHIATHSQTFEPVFHAADSKVFGDEAWAVLHMPAAHPEASSPPLIAGLEPWQASDLFAAVVYPHFMIALHGAGMAWYQVLPTAAGRLLLRIHVCVPASARALPEYEEIVEASAQFTAHVHAEDIAANDLVWRGLNAPMARQGRLSPLEAAIWRLNQWWLRRMQDA
ncbi:MAG: aromatic ring-hydroxylating oxygenase subunit alpha [Phenylobacterium sp.]|uniref:aromatic ring-hydroxylating oxygenase subunit alpha n=1 Tax=Phenylobacterium sp. TaxID=1871053 RepID=UPI00391C6A35